MSFFKKLFGNENSGAPPLSPYEFSYVLTDDPNCWIRQVSVTGTPIPWSPEKKIRFYVVLDHEVVPPPELHAKLLKPLIKEVSGRRCIFAYDGAAKDRYGKEIDQWLSPVTPHPTIQTMSYAIPENLLAVLYLFTVRRDLDFSHIFFCAPTAVNLAPPGVPDAHDPKWFRQVIAPAPTRDQLERLVDAETKRVMLELSGSKG